MTLTIKLAWKSLQEVICLQVKIVCPYIGVDEWNFYALFLCLATDGLQIICCYSIYRAHTGGMEMPLNSDVSPSLCSSL
jgi:hypothetical protein